MHDSEMNENENYTARVNVKDYIRDDLSIPWFP